MSEDLSDDRPIRYEEDDKVVYRASGLGACDRALIACARGLPGTPHPEWFQRVLDEGKKAEVLINAMWHEVTEVSTCNQQAEFDLEIGKNKAGQQVIVRCHIDGETVDRKCLREYKKFRDSTWPRFLQQGIEINVNYPWQVSVMMLAGEFEECEFVGGHAEVDASGELVGITEVECKHIMQPPFNFKAVRQRVMHIEKLLNAGFDASEVPCRDPLMYPCPWWKLHDVKPEVELYELPEGEGSELIQKYAKDLANWRVTEALAKKHIKEYQDGIKAALETIGVEAMEAQAIDLGNGVTLMHVRQTVAEHVVKESKRDYFQLKKGNK